MLFWTQGSNLKASMLYGRNGLWELDSNFKHSFLLYCLDTVDLVSEAFWNDDLGKALCIFPKGTPTCPNLCPKLEFLCCLQS